MASRRPANCAKADLTPPSNDRFDGWTLQRLLRITGEKSSGCPVQTCADPWRRLVIPHPEYALHGLNLSADTPAGHKRTCAGANTQSNTKS
jgi:hypothetical protein